MSKKLLAFLCVIQGVAIALTLAFGAYVYNDTRVALDFIKRNADICYQKLGTHESDVDLNYKYEDLSYEDLILCMTKLKEFELPHLIFEF